MRDLRVIDRVAPLHPREMLGDYATRLAGSLSITGEFDLGGASFGGMIALELARHLTPRRVYLFGSCRSPFAIAPLLRILHRVPFHPPRLTHSLRARYFGATSAEHIAVFRDMLAATPPAFNGWAIRAVFDWPGVADLAMPVTHVHGARDRVMPVSRVRPDHVIAGAGHLLTMTHAADVNAILA